MPTTQRPSSSDPHNNSEKVSLSQLIAEGDPSEMRQADEIGRTPLIRAVGANFEEGVRALIPHSEVGALSAFGHAAHHLAAFRGREGCLRWLAPVCELSQYNGKGQTALMLAAVTGALGCLRILVDEKNRRLQAGSNLQGEGSTFSGPPVETERMPASESVNRPAAPFAWLDEVHKAMDLARINRRKECVLFLESSVEWTLENLSAHQVLESAIQRQDESRVRSIFAATPGLQKSPVRPASVASLEQEAENDVNATPPQPADAQRVGDGLSLASPLGIAACLQRMLALASPTAGKSMMQQLAQAVYEFERTHPGLQLESAQRAVQRAFFNAASSGNAQALQGLMRWVDPTQRTGIGSTALMLAANRGHPEAVRALVSSSEVNAKDRGGYTALMMAAASKDARCVRELLSVPTIDPHLKNPAGQTAFELAVCARNWSGANELAHTVGEPQWETALRQGCAQHLPKVSALLEQTILHRTLTPPQVRKPTLTSPMEGAETPVSCADNDTDENEIQANKSRDCNEGNKIEPRGSGCRRAVRL